MLAVVLTGCHDNDAYLRQKAISAEVTPDGEGVLLFSAAAMRGAGALRLEFAVSSYIDASDPLSMTEATVSSDQAGSDKIEALARTGGESVDTAVYGKFVYWWFGGNAFYIMQDYTDYTGRYMSIADNSNNDYMLWEGGDGENPFDNYADGVWLTDLSCGNAQGCLTLVDATLYYGGCDDGEEQFWEDFEEYGGEDNMENGNVSWPY